jgi:hypothetical protein
MLVTTTLFPFLVCGKDCMREEGREETGRGRQTRRTNLGIIEV